MKTGDIVSPSELQSANWTYRRNLSHTTEIWWRGKDVILWCRTTRQILKYYNSDDENCRYATGGFV